LSQSTQSNRKTITGIRFRISAFLLFLIILFTPVVAYAHASVVKSNPVAGAAVEASQQTVQIWFDEAVQNSFYGIEVTDASGKRIDRGDGHLATNNHALLECTIQQNLKDGFYITHWHAVSDDGHHVSGTIPFSIGLTTQSMTVPAVSHATVAFPPFLVVANRWVQYLGLILLAGLLLFSSFILDKQIFRLKRFTEVMQKATWVLLTLLIISIVVSLPIQASIDSGIPFGQVWHAALLQKVLSTQFGQVLVWQIVLLFALVLFASIQQLMKKPGERSLYLAMAVLTLGLLFTKSLTGHAVSSGHPVYSVIADSFHLAAASIWLGSLVGIAWLLPGLKTSEFWNRESYWRTIRRFSIWGIVTVLVLVATGLFATFMNIPDMYTLVHTRYGQMLDIKLVLFIIMVLFALFHMVQGQKKDRERPLTHTIRAELALGLTILLVTAILTNLPTAKLTPGPYTNTESLPDGSSIMLHVTPNVAGVNEIDVYLKAADGSSLNKVDNATIALTPLDHGSGTNTYPMQINDHGQSKLVGLYLTTAGKWYVTVHVLVNKENDEYAHFQFEVGSPS
jgi:copper transport protein